MVKVEKCMHKQKCDFEGCPNLATYSISTRRLVRHEFGFCENCMKELYEYFSKMYVPKGVESAFKKNVKRRKDEK